MSFSKKWLRDALGNIVFFNRHNRRFYIKIDWKALIFDLKWTTRFSAGKTRRADILLNSPSLRKFLIALGRRKCVRINFSSPPLPRDLSRTATDLINFMINLFRLYIFMTRLNFLEIFFSSNVDSWNGI